VVNGNSPVSVRIAEFYSRARLVPDGRIVRLDLPAAEEIPFDVYERNVVPAVRKFIRDNQLEDTVRCLVLFHGTPLRVAAHKVTPPEQQELDGIRTELSAAIRQIQGEVVAFEQFVVAEVPGFEPAPASGPGAPGSAVDQAVARIERAGKALTPKVQSAAPAQRDVLMQRVRTAQAALLGNEGLLKLAAPIELSDPRATAETRQKWEQLARQYIDASAAVRASADRRFDPADRARLRELSREHFGLLGYARLLQGQLDYFTTAESVASLDSELSLLWQDWYPRSRWQVNPLYYRVAGYAGPRLLMTARIDGPDEQSPIELILGSLKAERDGLTGRIVVDSRGLRANPTQPSQNAYADFDQTLRNLAQLLQTRTRMPVLFDEREAVLPANSVRDVAIYVGWYSVGNYVQCCRFKVGAVGYHVASWEMATLRDPNNNGWVKGMLRDGIAASVGPVSEPYLFAFPSPEEFFPLLLTGRLTLAEVYWRTQQTTSWQMSLVGDPLYRPFAKNPQMSDLDLPEPLRVALGRSAGQEAPPTAPGTVTPPSPGTQPAR
jgi:uncharacterized protein (TIGR03790 family)